MVSFTTATSWQLGKKKKECAASGKFLIIYYYYVGDQPGEYIVSTEVMFTVYVEKDAD